MLQKTDYLILGNSAAGVTAAESIRSVDAAGTITIVSPEPYPAYGTPLISYLLEGKTTEDQLWFKDADFYEKLSLNTLFGQDCAAVKLNAEEHTCELSGGETIPYGKCLVATGSIPFTPPIDGLAGCSNVFPFLTLDDAKAACAEADALTRAAHEVSTPDNPTISRIVVIGGGLIGLKAAEALSYHADEIVVLELAPHLLPAVLDDEGAALLTTQLEARGIDCRPGVTTDHVESRDGRAVSLNLTDGSTLACDMIVAAVGVRPNSAIAVEAGAEQGRGLVVDGTLKTTLPDVYAAGDVTQVTDLLDGSKKPLALWPNAMKQGKVVGLHMAGAENPVQFPGNYAVNAVDFFDITLLTAGIINPPEGEGYECEISVEGDTYTKFVTKDGVLYGYILLNRPENAGIYTAMIDRHIPLSVVAEDFFDRAPQNTDFDEPLKWGRLHLMYPRSLDRLGWKVEEENA